MGDAGFQNLSQRCLKYLQPFKSQFPKIKLHLNMETDAAMPYSHLIYIKIYFSTGITAINYEAKFFHSDLW